jgi:hypothetical protein
MYGISEIGQRVRAHDVRISLRRPYFWHTNIVAGMTNVSSRERPGVSARLARVTLRLRGDNRSAPCC